MVILIHIDIERYDLPKPYRGHSKQTIHYYVLTGTASRSDDANFRPRMI
ncbi:hypothetical protein LCGC14_1269180 [marine sediment metagenome]|uniref:Uncharacterized protein n=1 Tax=marine sediment metagenome TaxID=412755 RepID=A0A0F9KYK4_9ZZZZ